MPKKYELINFPDILKNNFKLSNLAIFINKATDNINLNEYYNTCVFTSLLYSCIINSKIKHDGHTIVNLIIELHNEIFKDKPLDEKNITKMKNDIDYIKEKKLYNKITNIYYYINMMYNFFFLPKIYVIQE